MWNGNPIKDSLKGGGVFTMPQQVISTMTLFYYYGRIPQGFTRLWKLELLLFKVLWDKQIYENERNSNDVIVPNRTSKDKHCDLFSVFFVFSQA